MGNPSAPGQGKKAFYLFLCSILGMILFITLHQLITGLYFGLVRLGYVPDFALSYLASVLGLFIATLFGSWYGIWLGLYWYSFVYEDGRSPWFHAFRGGHSSRPRPAAPRATQPWSSRPSVDRWQLEDLLNEPSVVPSASNPEGAARSVTVHSIEVSAGEMGEPVVAAKKRPRKISTGLKPSRPRRTAPGSPNSEEL